MQMVELLGTASKHSSEWLPAQTLPQLRVDTCVESSGQISQVQLLLTRRECSVTTGRRQTRVRILALRSSSQTQKEGKVIYLYWRRRAAPVQQCHCSWMMDEDVFGTLFFKKGLFKLA